MKKHFTLLFFCINIGFVLSQEEYYTDYDVKSQYKKWTWQVKAGSALCGIKGKPSDFIFDFRGFPNVGTFSRKLGFNIGTNITFRWRPNWEVTAEMQYLKSGSRIEHIEENPDPLKNNFFQDFTTNNLVFPVYATYRTTRLPLNFSLSLGLGTIRTLSGRIRANSDITGEVNETLNFIKFGQSNDTKKTGFAYFALGMYVKPNIKFEYALNGTFGTEELRYALLNPNDPRLQNPFILSSSSIPVFDPNVTVTNFEKANARSRHFAFQSISVVFTLNDSNSTKSKK